MRAFAYQSIFGDGKLALAVAPALTPSGIDDNPDFFQGVAVYPQVLARGLLVLADITSTRYFNYTPVSQRDPVLSAQGDRLRAECFSACNGVYARLDLLQSGMDGKISFGTTNVDIRMELRTALTHVNNSDKLHVSIGSGGLTAARISSPNEKIARIEDVVQENPVQMPDRWIRALGNTAEIHRNMLPAFSLNAAQARMFVSTLPSATGKNQSGWLTPSAAGAKLMPRPAPNAVFVSGLHRLSAIKRVMTNITGMNFYMPADKQPGHFMTEIMLPGARLTVSLTAEAWQGYSGEGALLSSLAQPELLEDAESIMSMLEFNAVIDELEAAKRWNLSKARTEAALSLLAVSGKLGFDAHDGAYFHRELPDEPDRVLKDNPRLIAARKLVEGVKNIGAGQWSVHSNDTDYRVTLNDVHGEREAKCTCTWYLNHLNKRGPCKHILAVQLKEGK